MDGFKNMGGEGNPMAAAGAAWAMLAQYGACVIYTIGCCSCLMAIGNLVLFIFLAIYAFGNPDNEGYFGKRTSTIEGKSVESDWMFTASEALGYTNDAGEEIPATVIGEVDNVHGNFVTWFTWGFLNYLMICGFQCLGAILVRCMPVIGMICMYLSGCVCCSSTAWWIAGIVWRFRTSGKVASTVENENLWKLENPSDADLSESNSPY